MILLIMDYFNIKGITTISHKLNLPDRKYFFFVKLVITKDYLRDNNFQEISRKPGTVAVNQGNLATMVRNIVLHHLLLSTRFLF